MAAQPYSAAFNGTQDYIDVTWTPAFTTDKFGIAHGIQPSDGSLGLVCFLAFLPAQTDYRTGARVYISAPFTGTIRLIVYDAPT